MNNLQGKPSLMLWLVAPLLALLPLLAVLQYRWLGKVSEGERERMKANLNASARQFSQEFDREVTTAYVLFQSFGDSSSGGEDFGSRFRHWQATSAHPRLIREIYQTQTGADGQCVLTRFNPTTSSFELCEWPASLAHWQRQFAFQQNRRESLRQMLRGVFERREMWHSEGRPDAVGAMVVQISMGPVDGELPGLLIPVGGNNNAETLPIPDQYRIVVFDAGYITQDYLPQLLKRHFSQEGATEYNVGVIRHGQPEQIVFSSDPRLPAKTFAEGDAAIPFFRLRLNETNRLFLAELPHANETSKRVSVFGSSQKQVSIKLSSEIGLHRSNGLPKPEDEVSSLLNQKDEGRWQIVIKHRAGSLDAAVGSIRRRNLAISFGVLLLLGVSVGLIVLSSRRAQKLATQQMEFVAGVSHELRTPLAVICSAAENLADGVIDNRDQIKRYGGLIRDEGRRLTGMVEQVLEFAGAQSGRQNYELRPTELPSVIQDALAANHLQLLEGGFEIETKLAASLPLIRADAAALSRAIQNLLSNAMKYSGDNRRIELTAEKAGVEGVQVTVSDQGIGIASAELSHIFEPFYRGKEVAAAQIRGNGLGLSLVEHIVTAHGGRISVESKIGQGSVFTLHLPALTSETPMPETTRGKYEQAHFVG